MHCFVICAATTDRIILPPAGCTLSQVDEVDGEEGRGAGANIHIRDYIE